MIEVRKTINSDPFYCHLLWLKKHKLSTIQAVPTSFVEDNTGLFAGDVMEFNHLEEANGGAISSCEAAKLILF